MEFVKCPNLPQNSVKTLILGQKYAEFLDLALKRHGISPIYVPDNPDVDERMSGHADLSVLHIGGARLICAKHLNGSKFSEKLTEEKEIVSFEETEADRLVKGMSHEEYYGDSEDSENKIVAKEFRDCIISTDNKTMIVQKKKGELILLFSILF